LLIEHLSKRIKPGRGMLPSPAFLRLPVGFELEFQPCGELEGARATRPERAAGAAVYSVVDLMKRIKPTRRMMERGHYIPTDR
jgi:hypothetical protein